MDTTMHMKPIRIIRWPRNGKEPGFLFESGNGRRAHLSATHHGDHDEFWIVITGPDGREVQRYNPRYVDYITWGTPRDNGGEGNAS